MNEKQPQYPYSLDELLEEVIDAGSSAEDIDNSYVQNIVVLLKGLTEEQLQDLSLSVRSTILSRKEIIQQNIVAKSYPTPNIKALVDAINTEYSSRKS